MSANAWASKSSEEASDDSAAAWVAEWQQQQQHQRRRLHEVTCSKGTKNSVRHVQSLPGWHLRLTLLPAQCYTRLCLLLPATVCIAAVEYPWRWFRCTHTDTTLLPGPPEQVNCKI